MGCTLKFRSPNVYTVVIVTKIKKGFLKKKDLVKGLFIFYIFYFYILFICYDLNKLNLQTKF